jgi:hypothetical protein
VNNEQIAQYFRETYGTDITAEDLQITQEYLWEQRQDRARLTLASDPGYIEPTADIGKAVGVLFGAVLGAVLLPGLGVVAGWGMGALIGGSIGYRLTSMFDGPKTAKITPPVEASTRFYDFGNPGDLSILGSPIPKVYGNRSINSAGGVRLNSPPQIYSRLFSNYSGRVFLSLSTLSYGRLGSVNLPGLTLDDKPRADWPSGDVLAEVSSGFPGQSALADRGYSQCVAINSNGLVGLNDAAGTGKKYTAAITTSKAVNALDLALEISVWARNATGDLVSHAQAVELSLTRNGTNYVLMQILVRSPSVNAENVVSRLVEVIGLPKDIYKINLRPITAGEIIAPINELVDNAVSNVSITTPLGTGIVVRSEFGPDLVSFFDAAAAMSYTNKPQRSGDRGPQLRITHVNELVDTTGIDQLVGAPTYPKFTIARLQLLASDRMSSIPGEGWDIAQGAIVPNYIAAAKTTASGSATVTIDPPPVPGSIAVGDRLRILGRGTRVITAIPSNITVAISAVGVIIDTVINTSIATVTSGYTSILVGMPIVGSGIPVDSFVIQKIAPDKIMIGGEYEELRQFTATATIIANVNNTLLFEAGDEIVVYRMQASCYFPDLYVDRLINPLDGLGNFVDRDHFIDYPSIVKARQFCVRNNFYFDGVIGGDTSFEQWATATAPSSLLFCTVFEGKYALVPQEDSDSNPFLFNDSNTIKYAENGVPWQQQATNTVLVKYQTFEGRERQIKISTQAAANKIEPEIAQTISTQGVTSKTQAIKVGQVSLKSLKNQDRTCQIVSDVSRGLYVRQGDFIRSQHTVIEFGDQENGFVMTAQTTTNPRNITIKAIPLLSMSAGYLVADGFHEINRSGATVTDSIQITGNSNALNNGTYPSNSILWVNEQALIVAPAPTGGAGTGGTLNILRQVYDQIITISEAVTITGNSRITIAHKNRVTEQDKQIVDLGGGNYRITGVEQPIEFGDAFAIGELGIVYRKWRVTSIQPEVASNQVTLTGVLWDADVLSPAGLVTIE